MLTEEIIKLRRTQAFTLQITGDPDVGTHVHTHLHTHSHTYTYIHAKDIITHPYNDIGRHSK